MAGCTARAAVARPVSRTRAATSRPGPAGSRRLGGPGRRRPRRRGGRRLPPRPGACRERRGRQHPYQAVALPLLLGEGDALVAQRVRAQRAAVDVLCAMVGARLTPHARVTRPRERRTRYVPMSKPAQQQHPPGAEAALRPRADHGEHGYRGSGRLAGKAAVITGGDSGIGKAVAIACAREGADVLISYHGPSRRSAASTSWSATRSSHVPRLDRGDPRRGVGPHPGDQPQRHVPSGRRWAGPDSRPNSPRCTSCSPRTRPRTSRVRTSPSPAAGPPSDTQIF